MSDVHHTRPDIADVVKRMETIMERIENERDEAIAVVEAMLDWAETPWAKRRASFPKLQWANEVTGRT